jgi:sugar lactone lactonase YvrE
MGISDRLLGKKNSDETPRIDGLSPSAALPGGEVRIIGQALRPADLRQPSVKFGQIEGAVVISADDFMVARVPPGAASGPVVVATNGHSSNSQQIQVAGLIADDLHPVTNPALDAEGNIFATLSGPRGQKVPVSIFKIDTSYQVQPFLADIMNPTAIAFDRAGQMYVSSRHDEKVYRVARNGTMSTYAEGMGVATGIAFDKAENLYVGDRNGTVFKVAPDRQIFVFAMLEPSVSAYHMAFGPNGDLFVTGPTTSSFDAVHKIDRHGAVTTFYRGLGRPQGLAFDIDGNLYVAASLSGKRGIVKITPDAKASLEVAGTGLVGLAFAPGRSVILATNGAIHRLSWDIQGLPLLPEQ